MKVATVVIPPPMPSARIALSHSGTPRNSRPRPKPSTKIPAKEMSKKSMKAPPRFWVKRNITYMTARKIGRPSQRFRITRSMRSVMVVLASPRRVTALSVTPETNA